MSRHISSEKIANPSQNEHLESIIERRLSRRGVLQGGVQLASATLMGVALAGCSDDVGNTSAAGTSSTADNSSAADEDENTGPADGESVQPDHQQLVLGFDSVRGAKTDGVVVPEGYLAQVLIPWGTPLNDDAPDWHPELEMTPDSQLNSVGMHHDGMYHFPLSEATASREFILAVNHEYIDPDALWKWKREEHNGQDFDHSLDGGFADPRDAQRVRTEMNAHGITLVHVRRSEGGQWQSVKNSIYNRRITSATPVSLSGPVARTAYVKTRYSPEGSTTRGTNSNCGCGFTPWGTYLSCEENWPDYFRMGAGERRNPAIDDAEYLNADDQRLMVGQNHSRDGHSRGNNRWYAAATDPLNDDGEFSRWYPYGTIQTGADGKPVSSDPTQDFRNETRTFGYVVEVDPYSQTRAVKRTHLGRFRHEGCWLGKLVAGQPLVYYMGHDGLSEYLYRFVSDERWDPADANRAGEQYDRLSIGAKYLDRGVLYVARFNDDGTGTWVALQPDEVDSQGRKLSALLDLNGDDDLAGLIIHTCDAADCMAATSLDRPEWGAVDPESGRLYLSCTNNWRRRGESEQAMGTYGVADITQPGVGPDIVHPDAVTPRYFSDGANRGTTPLGNEAGQIITLQDEDIGATTFTWDIFVFGAGANDLSNRSGLTELNQFAQPDGLFYDDRGNGEGILWIETDNGYDPVENYTNDQLLAVIPGAVSKASGAGHSDAIINAGNQQQLKRFLVSPNGCEVTGIFLTPDRTSLFLNIQHPGNWPLSDDATRAIAEGLKIRPRSATVVVQKQDGGKIGV
jgi:secreted PhoX family phosphatase